MAHVLHPHVLPQHRLIDAVGVGGQQLRSAEALPPHPGRPPVQTQDLGGQPPTGVSPQPVLALAAGPRLLLVGGRRLVDGVDVEGVPQVGVRVPGLRVGDGLVRGREVRRLEVRRGRVGEGGRRAVQVLADRRQVGQPRVPIAAAVVSFLGETVSRETGRRDVGGVGRARPSKEEEI